MTAQKKVAGGYDTTTATSENTATVSAGDADRKAFATLAAQYALTGHALVRACPDDSGAAFYVMRWGWIKPLASLDAASRFLAQIGGAQ